MFCNNCGSNIPDGSNMCPNCGAPQYNNAYNDPYQVNYNQPYQAPAQSKNNTLVIVGAIVAIAAIVAIIIAIIVVGKKKDDDSSSSSSSSYDGRYVTDLGGGATMTLTVTGNGSRVKLTSEAYGQTAFELNGDITISGSSVTIIWDDSSYANDYGTYDASAKSITAEGYTFYKK